MALTAAVRYRTRERGSSSYIVLTGETIYHGALVGIDRTNGALRNWQDLAALRFKGLMSLSTDARFFNDPLVNSVVGNTVHRRRPRRR